MEQVMWLHRLRLSANVHLKREGIKASWEGLLRTLSLYVFLYDEIGLINF